MDHIISTLRCITGIAILMVSHGTGWTTYDTAPRGVSYVAWSWTRLTCWTVDLACMTIWTHSPFPPLVRFLLFSDFCRNAVIYSIDYCMLVAIYYFVLPCGSAFS